MPGTITGDNNQVTINITDIVPPDNMATIDKNGVVGNTYSKTQFDQSFSAKSEEIDTKIENIQQMVESDFRGTLNPADAAPTEDGTYKPAVSSEDDKPADPASTADWGKVYPNAGNLRAKSGYDTLFYKKGAAWKKAETKMPQAKIDTWAATAYPAGKQVFNEGKIYEAIQDVLATDVPGVSSKWKEMVSSGLPSAKFKKIAVMGDSTLDAYSCRTATVASRLFSGVEKNSGYSAVNFAVQGHTINQQLSLWNAYTEKSSLDIIFVQIGLNDLSHDINTILTDYQNLITQIKNTKRDSAKLVLSCVNPIRQSLEDNNIPNGYSNWLALNSAIMNTITGADFRNDYHVYKLGDSNNRLKSIYDCGDHTHENQAGADIIIQGFRNIIFTVNSYDKADRALQYFIEQPAGALLMDKDFNLLETGNSNLYGVPIQSNKLLQSNNNLINYSENGTYFYVYQNIPLNLGSKKINKIDLSILLLGNTSGGNNSNLVGIKTDGTVTPLLSYKGSAPTGLQSYIFDLTDYAYISIGFIINSQTGSLNQHVKFYSQDLGSVDNSVYNLINTKASKNTDIDLIEFGCAGDGVTDDTVRFNAAIALAMETGRRVYGRSNTYKVSRLVVPKTTTWKKIEIYGDGLPMLTCGTIGTLADYNSKQKGMVIISDYANPDEGVIFAEPQPNSFLNFSLVYIALRNMVIRTTDNPKTCGVMAYYAIQLLMENVFVDTGIYNVQSAEPTTVCAGIVVPGHSNGAMNYLRNVWVAGYYSGLVVFEHTDGDNVIFHSCKNALTFKFAEHASYFKRVLSQRCTNVVNVEAKCRFEISQLNCEYVGSGQSDSSNAWQKTQYELKDPQNLGVGRITYANSRGVTGANEVFRITGGAGVIVKYIGSDTRLTGSGVPDPNPIT